MTYQGTTNNFNPSGMTYLGGEWTTNTALNSDGIISGLEDIENQDSNVLLYTYFSSLLNDVGKFHIKKYYKESLFLCAIGEHWSRNLSQRHKQDFLKRLYVNTKQFVKQNQIDDIRNVDPVVITILRLTVLK